MRDSASYFKMIKIQSRGERGRGPEAPGAGLGLARCAPLRAPGAACSGLAAPASPPGPGTLRGSRCTVPAASTGPALPKTWELDAGLFLEGNPRPARVPAPGGSRAACGAKDTPRGRSSAPCLQRQPGCPASAGRGRGPGRKKLASAPSSKARGHAGPLLGGGWPPVPASSWPSGAGLCPRASLPAPGRTQAASGHIPGGRAAAVAAPDRFLLPSAAAPPAREEACGPKGVWRGVWGEAERVPATGLSSASWGVGVGRAGPPGLAARTGGGGRGPLLSGISSPQLGQDFSLAERPAGRPWGAAAGLFFPRLWGSGRAGCSQGLLSRYPTLQTAARLTTKAQESRSKASQRARLWVRGCLGVLQERRRRVLAFGGDSAQGAELRAPGAARGPEGTRGVPGCPAGLKAMRSGPGRSLPRRARRRWARWSAGRGGKAAGRGGDLWAFQASRCLLGPPIVSPASQWAAAAAVPAPAAARTGARARGGAGPPSAVRPSARASCVLCAPSVGSRPSTLGVPPCARPAPRALRVPASQRRARGLPWRPLLLRCRAPGSARLARPAPRRPGRTHSGPFFPAPRNHMANPRRHSSPRSLRRRMPRNRGQ